MHVLVHNKRSALKIRLIQYILRAVKYKYIIWGIKY